MSDYTDTESTPVSESKDVTGTRVAPGTPYTVEGFRQHAERRRIELDAQAERDHAERLLTLHLRPTPGVAPITLRVPLASRAPVQESRQDEERVARESSAPPASMTLHLRPAPGVAPVPMRIPLAQPPDTPPGVIPGALPAPPTTAAPVQGYRYQTETEEQFSRYSKMVGGAFEAGLYQAGSGLYGLGRMAAEWAGVGIGVSPEANTPRAVAGEACTH